jgi:hypothetical protein
MIITGIVVFSSVKAIPEKQRSNNIEDFSVKVHDYKTIEGHPLDRISQIRSLSPDLTVATTTMKTINHTPSLIRLLDEPSNDTNIKQTPMEDEDEIDSFLKIDAEELSKQLINIEFATDGSGYSMFKFDNKFLKTILFFLYSN